MPLHPLLASALRRHRLIRFFNSLPESARNDFDRFIRSAKKEATCLRRLEQTIELLTTVREAELDPPPALKAAFAHNSRARRGWELMARSLRRQYLIHIFRSPYPDTRARHLEYAVRDSTKYAPSRS
jgi:uncharacterized protein YdeI (YjbR/CyaY-like superfamily)